MSDIITSPGLYVLRNGDFVAICRKYRNRNLSVSAEDYMRWDSSSGQSDAEPDYDVLRRATLEEVAKFCGGGDE